MRSWIRAVGWAAAVLLPGGVLLLPVLVADGVARRREAQRQAPVPTHG